jgi:hypothetical protein
MANPAYLNPLAQSDRQASHVSASESVQGSVKQTQTDTVTISSQALKMASQSYSPAEATKENAPEKTYKRSLGKH